VALAAPPALALAALLGAVTDVYRRVDIYEEDGTTPYLSDVGFTSGQVTIDSAKDERRMLDLVIGNPDGAIKHGTDGLWYDKIIKPYRGCYYLEDGIQKVWEVQLGEFMIDELTSQNFPHSISVKGRDYTKKMLEDQFTSAVTFPAGRTIESVIDTIAANGFITKRMLPVTGHVLGKDFTFEAQTSRWKACVDIATAYGHELYFDANGYLTLREYQDPTTSPTVFTFTTGATGTIASWSKTTNDTRIYNKINVTGSTDGGGLPAHATATNDNPASPTSTVNLKRTKVYNYSSSFIETDEQAQDVADKFLAIHALEEFTLSLQTLVLPWLEAGEIISFEIDDAGPLDPTRFLLSSFAIPLGLGTMSPVGKKVEIIG